MAKERSLKKVKCHFSVPLQNRPACLSLGLAAGEAAPLSLSPLPCNTDMALQRRPPCPQPVFTCGEVEGSSVCHDGCDLQCRHAESPHAPGQALGSPPFFAFGWGPVRRRRWGERVLNVGVEGVCQALSHSPGGSARALWPRGGKKALPPTPQQGGVCWQQRPDPHRGT